MKTAKKEDTKPRLLGLQELTDGRYMLADEVAAALGISTAVLHTLATEKRVGRADRDQSIRSMLLPDPFGRIKNVLVWEATTVKAVAEEFKQSKGTPGRRAGLPTLRRG